MFLRFFAIVFFGWGKSSGYSCGFRVFALCVICLLSVVWVLVEDERVDVSGRFEEAGVCRGVLPWVLE